MCIARREANKTLAGGQEIEFAVDRKAPFPVLSGPNRMVFAYVDVLAGWDRHRHLAQ